MEKEKKGFRKDFYVNRALVAQSRASVNENLVVRNANKPKEEPSKNGKYYVRIWAAEARTASTTDRNPNGFPVTPGYNLYVPFDNREDACKFADQVNACRDLSWKYKSPAGFFFISDQKFTPQAGSSKSYDELSDATNYFVNEMYFLGRDPELAAAMDKELPETVVLSKDYYKLPYTPKEEDKEKAPKTEAAKKAEEQKPEEVVANDPFMSI